MKVSKRVFREGDIVQFEDDTEVSSLFVLNEERLIDHYNTDPSGLHLRGLSLARIKEMKDELTARVLVKAYGLTDDDKELKALIQVIHEVFEGFRCIRMH
jgi:hypothetical protein